MGLLEKLQSGESTFGYKGEQPKPITVVLEFLSEITRLITPDIYRQKNIKWIRWSKEVMLLSIATK